MNCSAGDHKLLVISMHEHLYNCEHHCIVDQLHVTTHQTLMSHIIHVEVPPSRSLCTGT